ncbi:unnamed protein product [Protopolystoma xenopodis]|uniref:Uncharacterized protein n=1 Tax=Protopolystoma xenopodis TaxID=117903 RepID=A0A3S5BUZ8_9PLAT|nr:unnamed protein product [Protopolystoma xenopodis]
MPFNSAPSRSHVGRSDEDECGRNRPKCVVSEACDILERLYASPMASTISEDSISACELTSETTEATSANWSLKQMHDCGFDVDAASLAAARSKTDPSEEAMSGEQVL